MDNALRDWGTAQTRGRAGIRVRIRWQVFSRQSNFVVVMMFCADEMVEKCDVGSLGKHSLLGRQPH